MSSSEPSTPEPSLPRAPRRRWGLTLLWLLPALALLLVFVYGFLTREPADPGDTAPHIGKPLADFTLPDLQGQSVQLAALRGKVVFVNVWATWCPPCVEEMPTIQQLYERLHSRGLEILAVSLDALGAQVVVPFMQSHRLSFPTLLDTKNLVQRLYRRQVCPRVLLWTSVVFSWKKWWGHGTGRTRRLLAQFERLLAMPATD